MHSPFIKCVLVFSACNVHFERHFTQLVHLRFRLIQINFKSTQTLFKNRFQCRFLWITRQRKKCWCDIMKKRVVKCLVKEHSETFWQAMQTDDVCSRHELNNVLIKPPLNLNHSSLFCLVYSRWKTDNSE